MGIKTKFYSKKEIAENYLDFRYGGESGKLILEEENSALQEFLPGNQISTVLDVPVGIGRISHLLKKYKKRIGADYSEEMLYKAKNKNYTSLVRCDAKYIPMDEQSVDIIVSLRFFLHYNLIDPFLREYHRLLKNKGILIFDTVQWSPRSIQPEESKLLGGKVYIHPRKDIIQLLKSNGFELVNQKNRFILPNFFYHFIPYSLVKALLKIEKSVPDKFKITTFWKFRKNNYSNIKRY